MTSAFFCVSNIKLCMAEADLKEKVIVNTEKVRCKLAMASLNKTNHKTL